MADLATASGAGAGAVSAGIAVVRSVVGMIREAHDRVVIGIDMVNGTRYLLRSERSRPRHCHIQIPAQDINPATQDGMLCVQRWPVRGINVVAVWRIATTDIYLMVYCKAPCFLFRSSNWLGIAFVNANQVNDRHLFRLIRPLNEEGPGTIDSKNFNDNADPFTIEDESRRFRATATMGTSHKAHVLINLRPTSDEDVPEQLKHVIRTFQPNTRDGAESPESRAENPGLLPLERD